MGRLSVLFGLLLLFSTSSVTSDNQQVTVKRLNSLISPYLSDSQLIEVSNVIAQDAEAQKEFSPMVTDVFNKLTNVLTSSQYSQVMSYVAQLGITMGPAKTAMSVNTLKEVLGNNLSPIYEQLCGYAAEMKKRGMQSTGIGKETFRVINSWLTHKRANTIFTRLSARFERSDWQKIRGAFGSMFRFSKYGL